MKFLISSLLLILFSFSYCNGQVKDNPPSTFESNTIVKEGKARVDIFFGTPYLLGNALKMAYDSIQLQGYNVNNFKNYNHWGAVFEYRLNTIFSLGAEYTIAVAKFDLPSNSNIVNGVTQSNLIYSIALKKQRILARASVHFSSRPKFDSYATVGIGYNDLKMYALETQSTNIVNYFKSSNAVTTTNSTVDLNDSSIFTVVSIRVAYGIRYFFTKNLGVKVEVGIGGPIVQMGLSFKFLNNADTPRNFTDKSFTNIPVNPPPTMNNSLPVR